MSQLSISLRNYSLTADSTDILSDVSFELNGSGTVAILARSGTGKSTLVKSIARLLDDTTVWSEDGVLAVNGKPVSEWNRIALRRKAMYVPQKSVVFGRTVADNLILPQKLVHPERSDAELVARAHQAIEQTQLADEISDLDLPVSSVSAGGQQQRLALARAFVLDPDCLMLDEPTSALDALAITPLENCILEMARSKLIVIVTHDLILARKCDRVLFLHNKHDTGARLVADGTPEQVLFDPTLKEPFAFMHAR
ncbi:ATP-binding cassette domain-containing protein [Hoeflea sp. AS60]|uniref:ABC transporter ATP-binding protein n=1 Tax=Hoeflea sp. AS60 TaxID=3135780 RepID=UPI003171A78D